MGNRTAQRLAFHLLRVSKEEAFALADAIREVKERIGFCRECGNLTEEELCAICQDTRRDRSVICVVESVPPRSRVRQPSVMARSTASSMTFASAARPREWRSIIAAESTVPTGFAIPFPAMSGAEPWMGSYSPGPSSPIEADGSIGNADTRKFLQGFVDKFIAWVDELQA